MSSLLYFVLSQCFTNYVFYTFREWKCALSQQNDKKLNSYLLEETFSHYFYKFLRPCTSEKEKIFLEDFVPKTRKP